MRNYFFIIIICFSISTPAQFKEDFNSFLKVGGDVIVAPAHWDENDFWKLGLSLAATSAVYFLDSTVNRFAVNNHNDFSDLVFSMDKYAFEFGLASSLSLYIYGMAAKDYKTRNLGLKLAEAVGFSALIKQGLQTIIGRARPYMNEGNVSFHPFEIDFDKNSFPSGHATFSFAYAKVMADHMDNLSWKISWYTLATLMTYARLYHNYHWITDVVMGSFLGYFTAEFVNRHYTNYSEPYPKSDFNFSIIYKL